MDIKVGLTYRERLRIELPADPITQIVMFGMGGVAQCLEDVRIPVNTPNILRRARALTSFNLRIHATGLGRKHSFEHDLMFPAVAEVILIPHPGLRPPEHLIKGRSTFAYPFDTELSIRRAVQDSACLELVQVRICPAHDRLKGIVEPLQRNVGRHNKPAPDRWPGATQCDLQPVKWGTCRSNPHPVPPVRMTLRLTGRDHAAGPSRSNRLLCAGPLTSGLTEPRRPGLGHRHENWLTVEMALGLD